MITTRPQPRSSIPGRTSCAIRVLTMTLPSKAACSSFGPVSFHEVPARAPKLLTRMSICPSASSVAATARLQPASVSTSAATPAPPMDSATRLTSASVRATTDTRAPSRARAWAMARPMPLVAAGTSGTVHADDRMWEDEIRAAAIRELFEEAGILLAHNARDSDSAKVRELVAGGAQFGRAVQELGLAPDFDGLVMFARWVTPAQMRRRFDA